jgi:Kef-type K+ transport system membrane component KefB
MFFLGLELDLGQIKANWKVTIPVACVSIIFPGLYNRIILPFAFNVVC